MIINIINQEAVMEANLAVGFSDTSVSAGKRTDTPSFIPRSTRPSPLDPLDFQQALAYFLQPPPGSPLQQSQDTEELLTINPQLNLKLISRLYPGASLVTHNGRTRVELADTPLKSAKAQEIDNNLLQSVQYQSPKPIAEQSPHQTVIASQGLDLAFGRVVVPRALTAVLMGQGVAQNQSLAPESVARLLQGRIPLMPVEPRSNLEKPVNEYSYWQVAA
jgi:hypothetical protein